MDITMLEVPTFDILSDNMIEFDSFLQDCTIVDEEVTPDELSAGLDDKYEELLYDIEERYEELLSQVKEQYEEVTEKLAEEYLLAKGEIECEYEDLLSELYSDYENAKQQVEDGLWDREKPNP